MAKKKNPPGPDGLAFDQFEQRLPSHLSSIRQQIKEGTYLPGTYRIVNIKTGSGEKKRQLAWLNIADKWVHRVTAQFISEKLEPLMAESCFSYRKGRGVTAASEKITAWVGDGYSHYLKADIENYFASIKVDRLITKLKTVSSVSFMAALVEILVQAEAVDEMGKPAKVKGLPLGFPISPVLSNLYLVDFDHMIQKSGFPYIRFGDDIFIMGHSRSEADAALQLIEKALAELDLRIKPGKTKAASIRGGFSFLGNIFREGRVYQKTQKKTDQKKVKPESPETSSNSIIDHALKSIDECRNLSALVAEELMEFNGTSSSPPDLSRNPLQSLGRRVFMRTLYLLEQGAYARLENQNIVITCEETKEKIPLRKIDQIVALGRVNFSTPLLHQCLKQRIPVAFISHRGNYMGRLESLGIQKNDMTLEQMKKSEDPDFRLNISRSIIAGRIRSQIDFLKSRRKTEVFVKKQIRRLETTIHELESASKIEELLGQEGNATRVYFSAFGRCVKGNFQFNGRNRRPPKDPVNSLLSFGYTLLYNDITAVLAAHGLNQRIGFLHASHSNRPALAMDLIEELRAPIVEKMVLRVVNQQIMKEDDFEINQNHPKRPCYMNMEAQRRFIQEYEGAVRWHYLHESSGFKLDARRIISVQAICLKKVIRGTLTQYVPARLKYS